MSGAPIGLLAAMFFDALLMDGRLESMFVL
jgi:hypothetical protein